jgi:hypothetical protein
MNEVSPDDPSLEQKGAADAFPSSDLRIAGGPFPKLNSGVSLTPEKERHCEFGTDRSGK